MASSLRLSCAGRPALALDELSTQLVLEYVLSDQPSKPSATRAIARAFVGSERRRAVYVLYRDPGTQPSCGIGRRIDTKKDPQSSTELRAIDDESTGCPEAGSSSEGEGMPASAESSEASDLEDLPLVGVTGLVRRRLRTKMPPPPAYRLLAARSSTSRSAAFDDWRGRIEEGEETSYSECCEACGQHVVSQVGDDDFDECNTSMQQVTTLAMHTYLDLAFLPPRAKAFAWARRTSLELCICGGGQGWVPHSCIDRLLLVDEEEDADGWQDAASCQVRDRA